MRAIAAPANLAGIEESATLGMTARAAALARSGRSILSLSAGEPDFVTPAYIREAAIQAIRDGHTHYPPAAGLRPLREAIARHVEETDGGPCAPDVLPARSSRSTGASASIALNGSISGGSGSYSTTTLLMPSSAA